MLEGIEILNTSRLKTITEQSKAARASRSDARGEAIRKTDEIRARAILKKLPSITERAAKKGMNSASVMVVNYENMERPYFLDRRVANWNLCEPGWLKGHAQIVYRHLEASGINPTLEFDHDGVGIRSWWNMKISW